MHAEYRKIALMGCLNIDPVDTFSLARREWVDELVLVGDGSQPLAAETVAILQKLSVGENYKVSEGDIKEIADARIAILNCCPKLVIGECRLEDLKRRAAKVKTEVSRLVQAGFNGVLLVMSEPVDILSAVASKAGKFKPAQVIGIGNGQSPGKDAQLSKPPRSIWCTGLSSNKAFFDHCDPTCAHFEAAAVSAKGPKHDFSYAGNRFSDMAICISRICQAVLNDERELLPVSTWQNDEYGVSGIFMTVPCIIGRDGVERVVKLPTTSMERQRIRNYAAELRTQMRQLERSGRRTFAAVL